MFWRLCIQMCHADSVQYEWILTVPVLYLTAVSDYTLFHSHNVSILTSLVGHLFVLLYNNSHLLASSTYERKEMHA